MNIWLTALTLVMWAISALLVLRVVAPSDKTMTVKLACGVVAFIPIIGVGLFFFVWEFQSRDEAWIRNDMPRGDFTHLMISLRERASGLGKSGKRKDTLDGHEELDKKE